MVLGMVSSTQKSLLPTRGLSWNVMACAVVWGIFPGNDEARMPCNGRLLVVMRRPFGSVHGAMAASKVSDCWGNLPNAQALRDFPATTWCRILQHKFSEWRNERCVKETSCRFVATQTVDLIVNTHSNPMMSLRTQSHLFMLVTRLRRVLLSQRLNPDSHSA